MASKQELDVETKDSPKSSSSRDASPPAPAEPNPWEKPGFAGSTRRALRSIQRYAWDNPDKSAEEKRFLRKLDTFLLLSACLGYFSKNLDQTNISNAYVSGMKESLDMKGSELTFAGNCFTAGYVVGQMPAVILATRVRPSILIPTLEIIWSVLTFSSSSLTSVPQLYAIRFLIGLCEGGYFPVMIVSHLLSTGKVSRHRTNTF